MVENNLFCFYTFYHKTRKKMFLSTILRTLSYVTMLFCLITYQNQTLQFFKLIGWYFFFVVLSTFPIILLVWHLSISYYYFNELKSIATDLQMAEIYADHNSTTYNEFALGILDRLLKPRKISPNYNLTITEDFMLTSWILHTKLVSDFNAWYCNLKILTCFNSMCLAITKPLYTLWQYFYPSQTQIPSRYNARQSKRKLQKGRSEVSNLPKT